MIKKIILILLIGGLSAGVGYRFGQKAGYDRGTNQAALNYSKIKKLEAQKVVVQKPTGPSVESVLRTIIGKWQNTDDNKFVREFTASSTFSDYHSGKKTLTGTISVFNAVKPDPEATFKIDNGVVYLKIKAANIEYPDFLRLNKITATELELAVIENGVVTSNSIIFKRIK